MKRRTLLGVIGLSIGPITGCLSQVESSEKTSSKSSVTNQPSSPTETTTSGREHVPEDESIRKSLGNGMLTDGESRKPHGIVLTNSTADIQTSRLTIRKPDNSVVHNKIYELGPEAEIVVSLTDPLRYSITANLYGADVSETIEIALERFDCNSSSATFDIVADNRIEVRGITTAMLCAVLQSEYINAGKEHSQSLGEGSSPNIGWKPHHVTITNPTDDTWTVRLLIERNGTILLDGIYTLESKATAEVTLTERGDYQGTVSVPISGTTEIFEPDSFDCNGASTNATIASDGKLDVEMITTDIDC